MNMGAGYESLNYEYWPLGVESNALLKGMMHLETHFYD